MTTMTTACPSNPDPSTRKAPDVQRSTWEQLLSDAATHYADVFRRSLSDLDRQGEQWTDTEVRAQLTRLGQKVWLSWDALPPQGGRR